MKMVQVKGTVISLYQASKWLKVDICSCFYDHGEGICYGFMVRLLTYHETSYGQLFLRTRETIYSAIHKIIEEEPDKKKVVL